MSGISAMPVNSLIYSQDPLRPLIMIGHSLGGILIEQVGILKVFLN